MHDFLLAKDIIRDAIEIIKEKGLEGIKGIEIEVGEISMAHDGFEEHTEDIEESSLKFGLESISKGTVLEGINFVITKTHDSSWKITNIIV